MGRQRVSSFPSQGPWWHRIGNRAGKSSEAVICSIPYPPVVRSKCLSYCFTVSPVFQRAVKQADFLICAPEPGVYWAVSSLIKLSKVKHEPLPPGQTDEC